MYIHESLLNVFMNYSRMFLKNRCNVRNSQPKLFLKLGMFDQELRFMMFMN